MTTYLANHPILAFSLIGSAAGTLLFMIAPYFTRRFLCANDRFCLGNLGLHVFIHINLSHFLENLLMLFPAALLCEKWYPEPAIIALIISFAFIDGMMCIPLKRATCGYSGVIYMLYGMACMHGKALFGYFCLGLLFFTCVISLYESDMTNNAAHFAGLISGAVIGWLMN